MTPISDAMKESINFVLYIVSYMRHCVGYTYRVSRGYKLTLATNIPFSKVYDGVSYIWSGPNSVIDTTVGIG